MRGSRNGFVTEEDPYEGDLLIELRYEFQVILMIKVIEWNRWMTPLE